MLALGNRRRPSDEGPVKPLADRRSGEKVRLGAAAAMYSEMIVCTADSGRSPDDHPTAQADPELPFDLTSPGANNGHLPAAHSMPSSARSSSDCGTVRPSALAILRLMTNSSFVGCSTGKSPGFAPLNILSIKPAAR